MTDLCTGMKGSCQQLIGVGEKLAERLKKCGIETVQDLLFHLPSRYEDRTRITPLADVIHGQYALIEGFVQKVQILYGRKRSLICHLQDETASIQIRFFYFSRMQYARFKKGVKVRCFGQVTRHSRNEMIHPEYQVVEGDTLLPVHQHLTPVYPTTEGLSQTVFRKLIKQALNQLQADSVLPELLPTTVMDDLNLPTLKESILFVHQPPPDVSVIQLEKGNHPAQKRLAFEELLTHHLCLRQLRQKKKAFNAPVLTTDSEDALTARFLSSLPFKLTHAQEKVIKEIENDLIKNQPMMRLVQGDVGCGKTVVAVWTMLKAIQEGYQAVLMAPTELLAEQHYLNFQKWLEPLNLEVTWLTGKLKAKEKREVLTDIESGASKVIVGTHALFQKQVEYQNLGLVVIDEQHRFGVEQRLSLRSKGINEVKHPHTLIMSATPIPRTLAMAFYADLDVSSIDALPPGRTPVKTVAIANTRRDVVIERVYNACHNKHQAYWVCTLIEESESLQCQAAEKVAEELSQQLPSLNIGLVHGRLDKVEKEKIMLAFKQGTLELLVATTVIEVGVDVPNASLMIVENPERLGLAQLHQLRGRVGRGQKESHCVLLYQSPLTEQAKERLKILRETQDGFVIAQKDLEWRGPGEVLGTRQTGLIRFKIADLIRDKELLPIIQKTATQLLKDSRVDVEAFAHRWVNTS